MGMEKMIRSVQTLILEIAVPRNLVLDLILVFLCARCHSEVNTGPDLREDR